MARKPMTPKEYEAIIHKLGLNQLEAAEFLGYTGRHLQRFAAGKSKIPKTTDMLLRVMIRYNLSTDVVERA